MSDYNSVKIAEHNIKVLQDIIRKILEESE